jgi:hypothetical protein
LSESKSEVLDELSTNLSDRESECLPRIQGKIRQERFPTGEGERAKEVLDRVHSDVIGPISPMSMRQTKYIIAFIDEASRYVTAVAIERKSEALAEFMKYKNPVEHSTAEHSTSEFPYD